MKFTGPTYRPPLEANTPLLQVTVGCAHNNCGFCSMFKGTKFSIEKIDDIENDIKELKSQYGSLKRIFLVNADAFVLSSRRLKEIANTIIKYFPDIEVITMYASIRNVMTKTQDELLELKKVRINDLWMGLETGNREVLKHLNKGYTLDDAYEQLYKLKKANIRYNTIFMLGAGGKAGGIQNAIDTANFINKIKPNLVRLTSLRIFEGTSLAEETKQKTFTVSSERERFEEEKKIIQLIELENLPLYANHVSNAVPIKGILPMDKIKMIDTINDIIKYSDDDFLNSTGTISSI